MLFKPCRVREIPSLLLLDLDVDGAFCIYAEIWSAQFLYPRLVAVGALTEEAEGTHIDSVEVLTEAALYLASRSILYLSSSSFRIA